MWVTNWARRHTKRVVQRLVQFGLSSSDSEIELRFFDINTQDRDKSFEFEYVLCRMSPEEAMRLGHRLQTEAAKCRKPDVRSTNNHANNNSWRNW